MGLRLYILLLGSFLGQVLSLPPQISLSRLEQNGTEDINESDDIFSKILKSNQDTRQLQEGDIAKKIGRSAIKCSDCKWPKSTSGRVIIPYMISSDYNAQQVSLITAAMDEFESLTCVSFTPWTTELNAISIKSVTGCWSYVGRKGGVQELSLATSDCMIKGIIQHELNHALGMYHEHCRSDRNNYVTIMTQYISPENLDIFNIYDTNNLGLEYDYESVMHFSRYAFSNTSGKATIIPKLDPSISIGQRYGLSPLDVSKINKLYTCDVCSNLLTKPNGMITSLNYPSPYPNASNCVWLIRLPDSQVALQFHTFDIRSSPGCASDYVRIFDGASKSSPILLDRVCGVQNFPPLISSSNLLLVEFVSDGDVTATGFNATYSTVKCGGTFYNPSKNFTSPRYPLSYYPSIDCAWTIIAPAGHKIMLTISDFNLEYGKTCSFDFLSVFDGNNHTSPLLFRSCGAVIVPLQVSTGNAMFIQLHSDESVQKRGFQAFYTITP